MHFSVFEFVLSSTQAFNQVGMFFGAMACLGLGGLILVNSLYWRVHAVRALGTIIGVTTEKNLYFPVYRYALPGRQTCEARCDSGSNLVRGKETGRVVPLLISPHNPTEAREANSYSMEIIGILVIAPGLWLAYTALTAYPITAMTWIMGIALLVYLLERGYRVLFVKGQHVSVEQWKALAHTNQRSVIDRRRSDPLRNLLPPINPTRETTAGSSLNGQYLFSLFSRSFFFVSEFTKVQ